MRFPLIIMSAAAVVSACAGADATADGAGTGGPCLASAPANFRAIVSALPGDAAALIIEGTVDVPTPGYEATWRLGAADKSMPPTQHVEVTFIPPGGMVAQVITRTEVRFETPWAGAAPRGVIVHCGDTVLAEISDVDTAY